jgi:hypothetical protein
MTISESVVGWTFFTVTDSEFLSWFKNQSQGIHGRNVITHYAIYTPHDCFDILATIPPVAEWLN